MNSQQLKKFSIKRFFTRKKSEINALRHEVQCLKNEVRLIAERQNTVFTGEEQRSPFNDIYTPTDVVIALIMTHLGLKFDHIRAVPKYTKLAQAAQNPLPDQLGGKT